MFKSRFTVVSSDNYQIDIWVYNHGDYSSHVFVCREVDTPVNSSNHDLLNIHGRDTFECLIKDAPYMSRSEILRSFDSWRSFSMR